MKENIKSGKRYLDQLDYLIERNRLLIFFVLFQIAVIIMLIIGYLGLKKDLVLRVDIPPKFYQTGMLYVGSMKANDLYYKVWGEYLVRELANFSPDTIGKHLNNVLYMLDPDKVTFYQHLFAKKLQSVTENQMVREFIPSTVSVESDNGENGTVIVKGVAKENIGNGLSISYKKCTYTLKMKIENYHLFVESIDEQCIEIPLSEFQKSIAKKGKE